MRIKEKQDMIEKLIHLASLVAKWEFKERYLFKATIAWNDNHEDDEIMVMSIDEGIAIEDEIVFFDREEI